MHPIDRYIERESLKISSQISGRKLIYLDIKFWVLLREQNNPDYSKEKDFLRLALELVDKKKCVFVSSDIIYYEILKQNDENTRANTLALVEKLSGGVSLLDIDKRIVIEIVAWLSAKQCKVYPSINQMVWSKLPIVVNYLGLIETDYADGELVIQNAYFDFWSNLSFTDLADNEILQKLPFQYKDNIKELNEFKILYEHQNKSKEDMFLSELAGFLNEIDHLLEKAMIDFFYRNTGKYPTQEEIKSDTTKEFTACILALFKQNEIGNHLPMLHIFPALFSKFRLNKDRKYKDGNDTMDVLHACMALPYCDYFFTENELCTYINQENLGRLYDCNVASKTNQVLEILQSI